MSSCNWKAPSKDEIEIKICDFSDNRVINICKNQLYILHQIVNEHHAFIWWIPSNLSSRIIKPKHLLINQQIGDW